VTAFRAARSIALFDHEGKFRTAAYYALKASKGRRNLRRTAETGLPRDGGVRASCADRDTLRPAAQDARRAWSH
jgi:hypothetical protein